MPFRLNLVSEVFQKKNKTFSGGMNSVHIMADDIIIAAGTVEEHDAILCRVLERARD